MFEKRGKRGLSTIVSTLLILLLVFVAIGILWVVIRNVIQGGAEQVSLGKFTLDLSIEKVTIQGNTMNVKVKRNPGEGEFTGLSFILDDGDNTEVVEFYNISMSQYSERTFPIIVPASMVASNVQKIEVAPIFTLSSGKTAVGDVKSEWNKPASSTAGGTTSQCTSNTQCNDAVACTLDLCTSGSCSNAQITLCNLTSDGCCPSSCTSSTDGDCIDCTSASQCNDNNTGTTDTCASGTCQNVAITACTNGDGYCPATCISTNDNDCSNECVQNSDCNDGNSSTSDTCSSGNCVNTQIQLCGNGNIDGTEQCDGSNLNSGTCASVVGAGYTGTLTCSASCTYVTTSCVAPSTLPQTGLVSWWTFDSDASDSVGSNDGTVTGAVHLTSGCQHGGGCYSFDGSGDYINVPQSSSLNISGDEITMSAWVKPSSNGVMAFLSKPFVIGTHTSPYFSYNLQLWYSGGVMYPRTWITTSGTGKYTSYSATFAANQWYHVVGVYNGATLCTYVNGSLLGSCTTATGNLNTYETPLRIGANGATGEVMNGLIDEVVIWNRALSASEVQDVYDYFN